ncbi:MAG TPA: IS21-like element helper ATPase IstB [Candidatus Dormibacteraeota bacterium]
MLSHHTIDKLEAMGLGAMADGLRQQMEQAQYAELSFEERLGLLVDREATWRENRRLQTRLSAAKLRQSATVEEIDFRAARGLDRALVLSLASASWVGARHNLLLTGATGCGKSFVACALAHSAIRNGHSALYMRTPRLLSDLALARGDGRYPRLLNKLARTELLVLDDFLLTPVTSEEAKDLLEIVEDRNQLRSTMVVSQLPIDSWHQLIPDPTLADAILDRLVQNAHRIALKGGSLRRRQPVEPTGNAAASTDEQVEA